MFREQQMQVLRREFESRDDRIYRSSFVRMRDAFPPFQDTEAVFKKFRYSSVVLPLLFIRYYTIDNFRNLLVPEPVQTTRPLI
jgi:hypothetical protein